MIIIMTVSITLTCRCCDPSFMIISMTMSVTLTCRGRDPSFMVIIMTISVTLTCRGRDLSFMILIMTVSVTLTCRCRDPSFMIIIMTISVTLTCRGRDLSGRLERLDGDPQQCPDLMRDEMVSELAVIKADIEACSECWQEAHDRLTKAVPTHKPGLSPS